ncbi:MAG: bifunctional riboflavin kinase/FAD synthetase [Scytonema sp. RU_4_4]|nr:bifunctional riboflavin kinase/FAD synthetase [Scytonema sp. RU_4_4]
MEKIANCTNSVRVTYSTSETLLPTAVALGKFDGLHRGHQRVIQPILNQVRRQESANTRSQLRAESSALRGFPPLWRLRRVPSVDQTGVQETENRRKAGQESSPLSRVSLLERVSPSTFAKEHVYPTVITFHPHPQEFFTGQTHTLLTPLDEKIQQLQSLGVEQIVLLPFNRELAALTPEEFVKKILVQQLQCRQISVGQDFRFGRKRSGTANDLQFLAAKYDIPVTIVPLQTCAGDSPTDSTGERISSSLIRQNLESGDIQRANQLLGRPYTIIGKVVESQLLDRTTGFWSVNLQLPKEKFLPRQGVYAVRVFDVDETSDAIPLTSCLGVMNIGNCPTVNSKYTFVEVHLLNWFGDLYGKKLALKLEKFLRPE